jgi:hypothetical protein
MEVFYRCLTEEVLMPMLIAVLSDQINSLMRKICTAIVVSTILTLPAFAQNQGGNSQGGNGQGGNGQGGNGQGGGHHPAPGPIAGAGLPALAVGYGVYWLIRRRRKPD